MARMHLYSAKVRLNGNINNEVRKENLTAAEIHLLRELHAGPNDPVVEIVHTGYVDRTDAKERRRLAQEYTRGELIEDRGEKLIRGLFGVDGVPLPAQYVAPITEQLEVADADDGEPEKIIPVEKPDAEKSVSDLVG